MGMSWARRWKLQASRKTGRNRSARKNGSMVPPGGKETEGTPKRCNRVGPKRPLVSGEGVVAKGAVGSFQIVLQGCEKNTMGVDDAIERPSGAAVTRQQGGGR